MLSYRTNIRVRYAETDQMKIVYYSRYLEYFEIGRLGLLRVYGIPYVQIEKRLHYSLPVLETYAKFYHPAVLEDDLLIITKVLTRPFASIRFDYEILRENVLITNGYTIHPFLNTKTGKPSRPPRELVAIFEQHFG